MKNKHLKLIYKKIDNTITAKELKVFDKKLAEDADFLREYNSILNIHRELKSLPEKELPPSFLQDLNIRIDECNKQKTKKTLFHPIINTAVIAAACVAIFFFNDISVNSPVNNAVNSPIGNTADSPLTDTVNSPVNNMAKQRSVPEAIEYKESNEDLITMDEQETIVITCKKGVFDFLNLKPDADNTVTLSADEYNNIKNKISDYIISKGNKEITDFKTFILKEQN